MSNPEKKYSLSQLKGAWAAGKRSTEPEQYQGDPHIGLYCLSFGDDGYMESQGRVIGGNLQEGYQVELYSWLTGLPNGVKIVALESMDNWLFYNDADTCRLRASEFWERDMQRRNSPVNRS